MIDDKMSDNIYCVQMIRLMMRFMIIFIVCVDDKIDNKNHNIYCVWMIRFMRRFIVCG
jgi:hypothetical protein